MDIKHTPGPWSAVTYSKRRFGLGQTGDCALYLIQCEYGDTTVEICRADVRLMAASPELLEAAELAEAIFARQNWAVDGPDPEAVALRMLRAAIGKATGVQA